MKYQYPLDYSALQKGDEFGYERLCEIVGRQTSRRRQKLAFLALREAIQKKRPELCCRLVSDGSAEEHEKLVILVDSVASEYNHARFRWGVRKLRRGVRGQAVVDRSNLTEAQKKLHDHHLHVDALAYRALRDQQRSTVGQLAAAARQAAVGRLLTDVPGAGVKARYQEGK